MTEIRYSEDHEWVRLEGDVATIGITAHAADALGDVVFVELPDLDRDVTASEACAVVESVKAASDVFAPLAGRVCAVNTALESDPAAVNRAPQGEGWFFQLTIANRAEFDALLDEAAYNALVEQA